jgi:hypothetical protein
VVGFRVDGRNPVRSDRAFRTAYEAADVPLVRTTTRRCYCPLPDLAGWRAKSIPGCLAREHAKFARDIDRQGTTGPEVDGRAADRQLQRPRRQARQQATAARLCSHADRMIGRSGAAGLNVTDQPHPFTPLFSGKTEKAIFVPRARSRCDDAEGRIAECGNEVAAHGDLRKSALAVFVLTPFAFRQTVAFAASG